MTGSEYLALAKHLIAPEAQVSSEARLRSAISRAYYAAFHKAKEITLPSDTTGGFDSHRQIVDTLQESDDKEGRQIGVDLDRLRGNRIHADYRSQRRNWSVLAEDAVTVAEDVIARLGSLR